MWGAALGGSHFPYLHKLLAKGSLHKVGNWREYSRRSILLHFVNKRCYRHRWACLSKTPVRCLHSDVFTVSGLGWTLDLMMISERWFWWEVCRSAGYPWKVVLQRGLLFWVQVQSRSSLWALPASTDAKLQSCPVLNWILQTLSWNKPFLSQRSFS